MEAQVSSPLVSTAESLRAVVAAGLLTVATLPMLALSLAGVPGLDLIVRCLVVGVGLLFGWFVLVEVRADSQPVVVEPPTVSPAEVRAVVRSATTHVTLSLLSTIERSQSPVSPA